MYYSCYIPLYLLYVDLQDDKAVQYLTFWTLQAVICSLSDEEILDRGWDSSHAEA